MITSPKSISRVDILGEDGHFMKIKQLHERWDEIHHEIDRQKQLRKDNVQEQLLGLEEKLNQKKQSDETRLAELRTHVEAVHQIIAEEKTARRQFTEEKQREIREVQTILSDAIENQKKNMEDKQDQINTETDEKILSVMENLAKMQKENSRLLDNGIMQARNKISSLQSTIIQERKKREDSTTQLTESIESDLNRLHGALQVQKKVRQETQNKLFKMIDEVHKRLLEELQAERRQRQQMNEAMLQLLEETCSKVERNFK